MLRLTSSWLAASVIGATACANRPPASVGDARIAIGPPQLGQARRAITVDDIVALREVHEPQLSPDGRFVAYLVKQAFRDCNCSRVALYVASVAAPNRSTKLLEDSAVSNVRWTPDSRRISYLATNGGTAQLWTIDPVERAPRQVFMHLGLPAGEVKARPKSVARYEWSPDGHRLAFVTEALTDDSAKGHAVVAGFRYDDASMYQGDLLSKNWGATARLPQLWVFDVKGRQERHLWNAPTGSLSEVSAISWASDGKRIAISYRAKAGDRGANEFGFDNYEIGVLSVDGGTFTSIGRVKGRPTDVAWAPDERSLATILRPDLTSSTLTLLGVGDGERTDVVEGVYPPYEGSLSWGTGGTILFLSRGLGSHSEKLGLYAVNAKAKQPRRLTGAEYKISECGHQWQGAVACVWQSPTATPRAALVDIASGRVRPFEGVNPELGAIALGEVREVYWHNEYGDETNGYLILPRSRGAQTRLPLVVIAYGFDGDFIAQASPTTPYPAQAFARDGMAVLLINQPRFDAWASPDFARGARAFGYGPLSSLSAIIRELSNQELIDPAHVGFMGHSWGGFWVEFAITHSELFSAVEIHNGGTSVEPGTYWAWGNVGYREMQEHLMGGPPYGASLKNYVGYSPTLNADKVRVPVLMEYDPDEALTGLEMFAALRRFQVPVELIVYPDDGHVFERPEHRYYSMQRNLDWFRFWLQGYEDPDPAKRDQYARWKEYRQDRDARVARAPLR